jgi:hypothetical protein
VVDGLALTDYPIRTDSQDALRSVADRHNPLGSIRSLPWILHGTDFVDFGQFATCLQGANHDTNDLTLVGLLF